jgi:hypothetical protein
VDLDPRVIQASIERDRTELAETIEELARRMDFRERLRDSMVRKSEEVRAQVREATPETLSDMLKRLEDVLLANPVPMIAVVAFAAGLIVGGLRAHRREG